MSDELVIEVEVLSQYRGKCSECGLVTYPVKDPDFAQRRVDEHRAWHEAQG